MIHREGSKGNVSFNSFSVSRLTTLARLSNIVDLPFSPLAQLTRIPSFLKLGVLGSMFSVQLPGEIVEIVGMFRLTKGSSLSLRV